MCSIITCRALGKSTSGLTGPVSVSTSGDRPSTQGASPWFSHLSPGWFHRSFTSRSTRPSRRCAPPSATSSRSLNGSASAASLSRRTMWRWLPSQRRGKRQAQCLPWPDMRPAAGRVTATAGQVSAGRGSRPVASSNHRGTTSTNRCSLQREPCHPQRESKGPQWAACKGN